MSKLTQGVTDKKPTFQKATTFNREDSWLTRFVNLRSGVNVFRTINPVNVFIVRHHHGAAGDIALSLHHGIVEQRALPGQAMALARPFFFDEVIITASAAFNNVQIIEAVVEDPVAFIIPATSVNNIHVNPGTGRPLRTLFMGAAAVLTLFTVTAKIVVDSLYLVNRDAAASTITMTIRRSAIDRHIVSNISIPANSTLALGVFSLDLPGDSMHITAFSGNIDVFIYGEGI